VPAPTEITAAQLARLVATPTAPLIIDVRSAVDFDADPRLLPAASRRTPHVAGQWAGALSLPNLAGRTVVVVCQKGGALSHGVAARLRLDGIAAEVLEGGFEAWRESGAPLVSLTALPPRDAEGRTVWVTRARPKVDRIACPWLIRRFVDPDARFLFVPAPQVAEVAETFGAAAFDIDGAFFSHRGEGATFDTMIAEFGIRSPALDRLAVIVRGADTSRPDLAPQVAGFLAASLGLSRMFRDDLEQLEAGMLLYDIFFRWCRDAVDEAHAFPSPSRRA